MKKPQQQLGLIWAEKRPRQYAESMLTALRAWWKEYQEQNVPEDSRGMVDAHVISQMAKGYARKHK